MKRTALGQGSEIMSLAGRWLPCWESGGFIRSHLRYAVEGWSAAFSPVEIFSPLLYTHVHAPQTGQRSEEEFTLTGNVCVLA